MTGEYFATVVPDNAYRYNGKELDEAIRLYDYGARYYDPAVARWGQVDPLAEQYAPYSPYNYVLGNPARLIDPDGMSVDTEIYNNKGKKIGEDDNGADGNVALVNNEVAKQLKKGEITADEAIQSSGLQTTKAVLEESLDVLYRTYGNGGLNEEVSVVTPEGEVIQGDTGPSHVSGGLKSANVPNVEGDNNTLIHSHITGFEEYFGKRYGSDSSKPSDRDFTTFKSFQQNVIVGKLGEPKTQEGESIPRTDGAVFFNREGQRQGVITDKVIKRILKN